jgi:hypothetical protein
MATEEVALLFPASTRRQRLTKWHLGGSSVSSTEHKGSDDTTSVSGEAADAMGKPAGNGSMGVGRS